MSALRHRAVDTPIGPITVYFTPHGLVYLAFATEPTPAELVGSLRDDTGAESTAAQLRSFFAGELTEFSCPVDLPGAGFQRRAQRMLADIPFGTTITYRQLAQRAGNNKAVRAAGTACARNPLPLIWPCHRVVRSDGETGNYRGGHSAKQWLLDFESGNRSSTSVVL